MKGNYSGVKSGAKQWAKEGCSWLQDLKRTVVCPKQAELISFNEVKEIRKKKIRYWKALVPDGVQGYCIKICCECPKSLSELPPHIVND